MMTISLRFNLLGYRIATFDIDFTDHSPAETKPFDRAAKWFSREWVKKMTA